MAWTYVILAVALVACTHAAADGQCAQRLEEIQRSKENGLPLIGVDTPSCDAAGNYVAIQCYGSVCMCVDENGAQLKSYQSPIGFVGLMDCKCARDEHRYETSSGAMLMHFDCASNGNYKATAAPLPTPQRPLVTAAPAATQQPLATADPSVSLRPLNGAQVGTSGVCAEALLSSQSSSLLGAFVPNCDADGKYAPRQCQGSECYCVRKDGSKIEGYSSPIALIDRVTCQCARDKDWYEAMGILGRIHTCRHNGNYQEYQCVGSLCYCTDDTGARIESQSVNIGNINDLNCN